MKQLLIFHIFSTNPVKSMHQKHVPEIEDGFAPSTLKSYSASVVLQLA